jgi:methylmalonyl-CoA/ethylmalonyl-CoA epimerase
LSELKEIDFATTSEILSSVDIKVLKRKSKKASVEQIGIGLSRLYDIDQSISKEIFEELDVEFLSNLFEDKPLTAFGHILKEFKKVEPSKAQNLIRHTLEKEFVISKLNSAKITTVDLFTFYLLFSQLDVRKEGKELLKKVNLDIIEGRVKSSNIKHSVQLVNAINEIDPSYGKKLVKLIPDEKLLNTKCYKVEEVKSENVKTAFFKIGESKIELLEATDPESPIAKYIAKRGKGMHHIAFDVEDIEVEIKRLEGLGFQLIQKSPKNGADNRLIAFLHPKTTEGTLVELCQERI